MAIKDNKSDVDNPINIITFPGRQSEQKKLDTVFNPPVESTKLVEGGGKTLVNKNKYSIYKVLTISSEPPYEVKIGNRFSQFNVPLKGIVEDLSELEKVESLSQIRQLCVKYGQTQEKGSLSSDHRKPGQSALKTDIAQLLTLIYCGTYVLSNLAAVKLSQVFGVPIDAGTAFFPFTFIIDDILTEVYGLTASRRAIFYAILMNSIVVIGLFIATSFPVSPYRGDDIQPAFEVLFHLAPKIFIASIFSFMIGELLNSYLLARAKFLRRDEKLWMRLIKSTICGTAVSSILFCLISEFDFSSLKVHMPLTELLKMVGLLIAAEIFCETVMIYPTCKLINYIKKKDNIDVTEVINSNFSFWNIFKKQGANNG